MSNFDSMTNINYHICPNRRALRECGPSGACLFIATNLKKCNFFLFIFLHIDLSIINCVWMYRCSEFEFICCVAKKFGVNRRWVQEWCQQILNGQTTKTKTNKIMSFWLESLSILLQIYTFACNFCCRKGGVLLLGSVLLLGHIRYLVFIWNVFVDTLL